MKQLNTAARRKSPPDVMSFSTYKITVGTAAEKKLGLGEFGSLDILLDLSGKPPKLALQLHSNGHGEFKIAKKKAHALIEIGCGGVLRRLRELGYGPGRYHYRLDQPEFLVFDLDLPATRIGG
ncbi:MAG: hypothetical protein LLG08_04110 [Actinomycetia bacterium]|nr:hypothetical protein [Actinomycetes bacterium]